MKFTVERTALAKALQDLSAVVNASTSMPICKNVLVEAEGATLRMTTTNLDMWATVTVGADVHEFGRTTADVAKLREIASVTPEGAALLCELEGESARLRVSAGRSRFTVSTLKAEDFPRPEAAMSDNALNMSAGDMRDLFDAVSFAMSTDKTRYYLCGCHIHTVGAFVRFVATDGSIMAYDERPAPEGFGMDKGVTIPSRAVDVAEAVLGGMGSESAASILFGENLITFTLGTATVITKRVDGDYPDYARLYAMERPSTAVLDTPTFESAIKRARVAAADSVRSVRFSFEEEGVILSSASMTGDVANDEIESDFKGKPLSLTAPSGWMLNILAKVRKECVRLHLAPGLPVLIEGVGETRARYLCVPNKGS